MRTAPNVIITGTPGVGKTVHCEQLAQEIGLKHLSVNQVAKDRDCYETFDEERKSWVVDEDKVCCCWLLDVMLSRCLSSSCPFFFGGVEGPRSSHRIVAGWAFCARFAD